MSMVPLRWGILGTGTIAHTFVKAVRESSGGRVVAVGSRTHGAAARFAVEFGGLRIHGSYDALLADPEVEAVYLAMPHPFHAQWAIRAAGAGKHILCEKPLTVSLEDARCVVAAARDAGVLLMEAFMYRCHPQTVRLAALVRDGAIGKVGLVQAAFGFHCPYRERHRLFANALGGGSILDVGAYPVSMARLLAGAAEGRAFADPVAVTGAARLHPQEGTDLHAAATLSFAGGLQAQVSCGVSLELENVVRVFGEEGSIFVPEPWMPAREGGTSRLVLQRRGAAPEEIAVAAPHSLYVYEVEACAAAVRAGETEVPAVTPSDTLGNMAALDAWRAAAGVVYRGEPA